MKRRVFGYARQTEHQSGGGVSATRQKALVEAYVAKYLEPKDHRWIGFFADRATAGGTPLSERKMGQKLCLLLDRGDVLVVYSLALLFSSVYDGTSLMARWINRDVRIVALDSNIDTDPAALGAEGVGQLSSILDDIANLSRSEHTERIRAGLVHARAEGRALNQVTPYGMKRVRRRGKVYLKPDEAERKLLDLMCELHDGDMIYSRIAERIFRLGHLRRSRRWSPRMIERGCRARLAQREREAAQPEEPSSPSDGAVT